MESGTSLQARPENNLPPLPHPLPSPPPNHHRRHIRHATPENSNPPQFILEPASSNQRSTSTHHPTPRAVSTSPPPPAETSTSQAQQYPYDPVPSPRAPAGRSSQSPPTFDDMPPLEAGGQDHDRMETDEEIEGSDGSGSDDEVETPEPEAQDPDDERSSPQLPPPPIEDEVMDTSPDNPPIEEPPPSEPPSQTVAGSVASSGPVESVSVHLVHVQVPPGTLDVTQTPPTTNNASTTPDAILEASVQAAERDLREMADTRGELRRIERLRGQRMGTRRREIPGAVEDVDGDEDSDDSSDEEEHPYWVNLKEDTSAPEEQELKQIEETGNEVSALDHEHWEQLVYEPLDDPEYVPTEAGRITWTVKGVHGTPEKPNREKIMRSPSILIGGYYWNIKYFPHGNDGTEQLSIYIECSPNPPEDVEVGAEKLTAPETAQESSDDQNNGERSNQGSSHGIANTGPAVPPIHDAEANTSDEREEVMEDSVVPPKKVEAKAQISWGTAAQISCVLYNPEEPRVNVYQRGCHRFYNDSTDWGWTRFHGPWDEIHKRQRFQRQALLRNDTLAFTAYIRTIKDDTQALWWHAPKDSPEWDSEAMTGVPAFECQAYQSSAMIAAVSSWMHLTPFRDIIRDTEIPDPVWEANKRTKPIFEEFQDLYDEGEHSAPSEDNSVSLRGLVSILNFYGAHLDSKVDVVRIWETLRRVLNFEASGLDSVEEGNEPENELFHQILLLKQPDLLDNADFLTKYPLLPRKEGYVSRESEPQSVQGTLDKAASHETNSLRKWQSFEGQNQETQLFPAVLQIELHRQHFAKEDRKWRKLTHQIKIDENVMFNKCQYTLYGMVVHSGDLGSNEFYSIIRPEGPGTRWIKYAGDNHDRKVTVLTTKQAVHAHEGAADAQGTAAVAYVVLYVRTDALPGVLCTPFKREVKEESKIRSINTMDAPQEDDLMDGNDNESDIPVFIYHSESFDANGGYGGRGICDPWTLQNEGKSVQEFSYPASTTVNKLHEHINGDLFHIEKSETLEFRLWPMNTFITDVGIRPFPSLLSFKSCSEETLDEMCQHTGGCRFWMKLAKKAVVPTVVAPTPAPTAETNHTSEQEARDAAIQAVMATIQATDSLTNGATQPQVDASAEAADTEMVGAENTSQETDRQVQQRQQRQQQLFIQMQQVQQQQQQLAAQHAQQRQQEAEQNAQQLKETYFFVKVFDADTQTLRGRGSAIVKSESKIVEETKKLLRVEGSESWDCYQERGIDIDVRDCVKSHETFEGRCGGADGIIIIAQRRPAAAQVASLEAEGKCLTPMGYFRYLKGHEDPSLFRKNLSSSYFGANYESGSLKSGVLHGQGTVITHTGDAYSGTFVAGVKSGHGSMDYANGDTYTGEWKAGEPNGQGQMTYAKTGNVYVGGFKKRKRHGKGTMTFEVADEEMQLCKICYESEMDALFYDCGHVVACDECARQVDVCPVCRKNVRAVVKIWRT